MEAIDQKIVKELQTLSPAGKEEVLAFLQKLKAAPASDYHSKKIQRENVVSENTEEYISIDQFIAGVKGLPAKLQLDLWRYLNKLQTKVEKDGTSVQTEEIKPHPKFEPGFGGAKGFFILKEGWDEPLDELFKDYM